MEFFVESGYAPTSIIADPSHEPAQQYQSSRRYSEYQSTQGHLGTLTLDDPNPDAQGYLGTLYDQDAQLDDPDAQGYLGTLDDQDAQLDDPDAQGYLGTLDDPDAQGYLGTKDFRDTQAYPSNQGYSSARGSTMPVISIPPPSAAVSTVMQAYLQGERKSTGGRMFATTSTAAAFPAGSSLASPASMSFGSRFFTGASEPTRIYDATPGLQFAKQNSMARPEMSGTADITAETSSTNYTLTTDYSALTDCVELWPNDVEKLCVLQDEPDASLLHKSAILERIVIPPRTIVILKYARLSSRPILFLNPTSETRYYKGPWAFPSQLIVREGLGAYSHPQNPDAIALQRIVVHSRTGGMEFSQPRLGSSKKLGDDATLMTLPPGVAVSFFGLFDEAQSATSLANTSTSAVLLFPLQKDILTILDGFVVSSSTAV